MGKEDSQKQFAEAKRLYAAGQYEEALVLLLQLDEKHPDTFNIKQPILQCYQHLGNVEKVKSLLTELLPNFPGEKHQKKLARVGRWVKRQEKKQKTDGGISKDSQIDNDIAEKFDEQSGDSGAELEIAEAGDTSASIESDKETIKSTGEENADDLHKSPLHKLLIVAEVIFIMCAGAAVMYFFTAKTTRKLPEFSADIVMEMNGDEILGKLYLKDADTFRMEIMDQVFVTNEGQVRKLLVDEEQYITVNPADVERYNPLVGLSNFAKWVRMHDAKKVGREKLQGFDCDIYQANYPGEDESPSMTTKVWYCRQIKFPLKSENRTEGSDPKLNGSVSVALSHIKTEASLPNKLFEIPERYTEFVKKKLDAPDPEQLEGLVDNMEKMLQFGDPTALLEQFQ